MPDEEPSSPAPNLGNLRDWRWLLVIALAFLAVRVPVLMRQPGGMDEDWFAVPGWTVSREGIPRVPFAPERNPESYFWQADVMLFALPPAYHYWQAPLFWILPPGFGTARLGSTLAGLVMLTLTYLLGRQFTGNSPAALWGTGLLSISRVFYFPATIARPDILCATFGLGMVLCLLHWSQSFRTRWLVAAGTCLGLAGLTHPFAVVMALQGTLWVWWWRSNVRSGIRSVVILGVTALTIFSLWLPLILQHPDLFKHQFFGNVLQRSLSPDPELGTSSLGESVLSLGRLWWELAGPVQLILMGLGLLWVVRQNWQGGRDAGGFGKSSERVPLPRGAREKDSSASALVPSPDPMPPPARWGSLLFWAVSAIVLLSLMQGRHPTKGYWVYPGVFCLICLGAAVAEGLRRASRRTGYTIPTVLAALLLIACFLPGMGLRTTWAVVRHWDDDNYNAPRFLRRVLADLPAEATLLVDPANVYNAAAAGRRTLLGVNAPVYFHANEVAFDYYLVSRYGLENRIPEQLNTVPIAQYGKRDDPFACYLEVHRPREQPQP